MKTDFENNFADFLEERLGKALFALRETNLKYRCLSDEYDALLNTYCHSLEEYQRTIIKIADTGKKLSDIEKRYVFLAGIREHTKIADAVSAESFEQLFTETE